MIDLKYIKQLGKDEDNNNLDLLISFYHDDTIPLKLKSEVVSSIGRSKDIDRVFKFIETNALSEQLPSMACVYQMFRTCLYKKFDALRDQILEHYDNEMLYSMYDTYYKKPPAIKSSSIKKDILLQGDCEQTLNNINDNDIDLVFTSPPYYNARDYVYYKSYKEYLNKLKSVFKQCHRVLNHGRFIVINVSPIITSRSGRNFKSIRHPIHYDLHPILDELGFEFQDEIQWVKPEHTVKNRNGGYYKTRQPLSYKPNCITESLMVYRKKCNFLLDKNIKHYKDSFKPCFDTHYERSNIWHIDPKSSNDHPAIFPEELVEKVLSYYSYPNDVILDPFAGSGTTGRVCKRMNRLSVQCEQQQKYCDVILNRG